VCFLSLQCSSPLQFYHLSALVLLLLPFVIFFLSSFVNPYVFPFTESFHVIFWFQLEVRMKRPHCFLCFRYHHIGITLEGLDLAQGYCKLVKLESIRKRLN